MQVQRMKALRKHVATVPQCFNLKEFDLDIFSHFMGHSMAVHRKYYRLPSDTLELAKVSKLLLTVEQGKLGEMSGKCLDYINPSLSNKTSKTAEEGSNLLPNKQPGYCDEDLLRNKYAKPVFSMSTGKIGKKSTRATWSKEEILEMESFFIVELSQGRVPGKSNCVACQKAHSILEKRSWAQLKYWVYNELKKFVDKPWVRRGER